MIFGDDQICLLSPVSSRKLSFCENCSSLQQKKKRQIIPTLNTGNFQQLPLPYLPLPNLSAGQHASHTRKCPLKTFQ